MNTYTKIPKKNLYIIATLCLLLVLFISLETIIRVKDMQLFEDFLSQNNDLILEGMTVDEAYSNYLILNLSKFFFKIVAPIFLSIHIYYTYKYLRMSSLFIFMWVITLLGSLSYIVLEAEFYSIFYYIDIFLYLLIIISIVSLNGVLNKSKEE